MYSRPVVLLIVYLNLICIRTQTIFDVSKSEKNYFNMKSAFLHNISIKIFNFLDLEQKYVKLNKSKALLTMFKHQNDIAENFLGTFDGIQNMTVSNTTRNSLNLRNILEDIIREEMHHVTNHVENSSVNKFDREFAVFVNIFFAKALKIFRNNFIKVTNRVTKSPILNTPWKRIRDIKVWKPSSVEYFDLFNNTRRIYKGKKAKIKDFPFLVSILINNEFASAGSIISKDLVITAATGLNILYKSDNYQELLTSVSVRVGSDYATKEGNLVSVVDVIFHPGYDPHSLRNNLAIVRLVRRLRFSDKRKIQRILYDKKGVFKKNSLVIVLGWGAKDAHKEVNFKQKVSVARLYLFDMNKCASMYSGVYVKDSNFCAGFSDKGGGACNKDTGGPGIIGGELAGVISFGPSVCGQTATPTVFTKIAANVEWIMSIINRERSLKIETITSGPETMTEPQSLFPLTYTMPVNLQQIPLETTLQAQTEVSTEINTPLKSLTAPTPTQLVSESLRSSRSILRVTQEIEIKPQKSLQINETKQSLKSHQFVAVSPEDLSNISLPFTTTYSHPTLFSESTSVTTEMYPDQTIILKEILKEIILSNISVIDYILYGDILEDNVEAKYLLSTTEAIGVMQHPLVNKSVFLIEKPEEIIQPVRTKTILPKPNVEDSHESSSHDERDISSQIELLNLLIPQHAKSDIKHNIEDDNNFKDKKTVSNMYHPDTSSTESSKKKVSNRLRNTILYGNIKNSNEVAHDLSSKLSKVTKDNIDDYYDDETNVKTTKDYVKQTKLTSKMYKKYENVVFNLDDLDPENRLDKMDLILVEKYSDKNEDDNTKQNKNYLEENQRFKMDRSRTDQYSKVNGNKKQLYHSKEKQQNEMDQMGRGICDDNYSKNQEKKCNENLRFEPYQKVQIRHHRYNDENEHFHNGKKNNKEYHVEKTENKRDNIGRMGKYSSGDEDHYNSRFKIKKLRETPDYNKQKLDRMERFTYTTHNYDYDEVKIPQITTEKKLVVIGKAAPIFNDEFDYNYEKIVRQNRHKNDRYRFRAYDKPDYNQRPMTDEDEKIERSNKRQEYKKSRHGDGSHGDDFFAIL